MTIQKSAAKKKQYNAPSVSCYGRIREMTTSTLSVPGNQDGPNPNRKTG